MFEEVLSGEEYS